MQPCRLAQLPTFMLVDLMLISRGFDIYFNKMSKYNKTTYFWYLFPISIMVYFKTLNCIHDKLQTRARGDPTGVVSGAPIWSALTHPDNYSVN